jgi:hypothetical protein
MTFVFIGAVLLVAGGVMSLDIAGLGTKWRNLSMSYYDRRGGPETRDRNSRRFLLYYRALAVFGLLLFLGGLVSLL